MTAHPMIAVGLRARARLSLALPRTTLAQVHRCNCARRRPLVPLLRTHGLEKRFKAIANSEN